MDCREGVKGERRDLLWLRTHVHQHMCLFAPADTQMRRHLRFTSSAFFSGYTCKDEGEAEGEDEGEDDGESVGEGEGEVVDVVGENEGEIEGENVGGLQLHCMSQRHKCTVIEKKKRGKRNSRMLYANDNVQFQPVECLSNCHFFLRTR